MPTFGLTKYLRLGIFDDGLARHLHEWVYKDFTKTTVQMIAIFDVIYGDDITNAISPI